MSTVLFNTLDLSLLITIYQCIIFAFFLLFIKKKNKQSNIFLVLFLLCHAAIPLDTLINFGEAFRQFSIDFSPNIFYIFGTAYWLESVLLLFYVRSLIYKDYQVSKKDIIYFIPVILYVCYEMNAWYLLDSNTKLAILNGYHLEDEPFYKRFINLFRESFRVFCTLLCLIELLHYQKQIKNQLADIEPVDLTWLKLLIIGFLVIRSQAVFVTLGFMSVIDLDIYINYGLLGQIANFTIMILIGFLIFFSLGVSNIFKGIDHPNKLTPVKKEISPEHVSCLTAFMQEHKPYLNHLLTLDNLAEQVHIAPRQLSQIINRHFEQNFFEYINAYRIEESKKLLAQQENAKITILEILDKAGFNSKATFNTFFKKIVGLTPTQYRKKQLHL